MPKLPKRMTSKPKMQTVNRLRRRLPKIDNKITTLFVTASVRGMRSRLTGVISCIYTVGFAIGFVLLFWFRYCAFLNVGGIH